MDLSYTVRRIFLSLTIILGLSYGQKIVHMNGTYDLDGDALLEFIALELDPNKDVFPTAVRYYEIDSDGYQTLIWEFTPPVALEGHFVDAQIGDLDGDGIVGILDILIVIADWGSCTGDCAGDVNGDGSINILDLLILIANWTP